MWTLWVDSLGSAVGLGCLDGEGSVVTADTFFVNVQGGEDGWSEYDPTRCLFPPGDVQPSSSSPSDTGCC